MPYHYDLWQDGITQSALKVFLQCPEQFRLQFVEGWTPKGIYEPFEFGTCFHYFLQYLRSRKSLASIAKGYVKDCLPAKPSRDEHNAAVTRMAVCEVLASQYLKYWKREDAKTELIATEVPFKQPIMLPNGCEVILAGVIDKVFRERKGLWIGENKTASRIDVEGMQLSLHLDMQTQFYASAAELIYGEPVVGVLYDQTRKPQLVQGKATKTKDAETADEYAERVRGDITSRPDWYFNRYKVRMAKNDSVNWRRQSLYPALVRLTQWWIGQTTAMFHGKGPFDSACHYMNPDALFDGFGRSAMFDMICTGNTFAYEKKKVPFPELEAYTHGVNAKGSRSSGKAKRTNKKAKASPVRNNSRKAKRTTKGGRKKAAR